MTREHKVTEGFEFYARFVCSWQL